MNRAWPEGSPLHVAGPLERRQLALDSVRRLAMLAVRERGLVSGLRAVGTILRQSGGFNDRFGPTKYIEVDGRWYTRPVSPPLASPTWTRRFSLLLAQYAPEPPPFTWTPVVMLGVTRTCHLSCRHCSAGHELSKDNPGLALDTLMRLINEVQERGVGQIHLTGGEPMARFDEVLALVRATRPDTDVHIMTSGVGMTPRRVRTLREAGLEGVWVSLDHWDRARHDDNRGLSGAFDAARRACLAARDAGLLVVVETCVTNELANPADLERLARVAGASGAHYLRFVDPSASGRWEGADVELDPAASARIHAFADALNTDPRFRGLPGAYADSRAMHTTGCLGSGRLFYYIDCLGEVRGCPMCGESAGSALDGQLGASLHALRARGCSRYGEVERWRHPLLPRGP